MIDVSRPINGMLHFLQQQELSLFTFAARNLRDNLVFNLLTLTFRLDVTSTYMIVILNFIFCPFYECLYFKVLYFLGGCK